MRLTLFKSLLMGTSLLFAVPALAQPVAIIANSTPGVGFADGQCAGFEGNVVVPISCGGGGGGGLTIGSTTIAGGSNGFILYNNAGTLGNLGTNGTGNVVLDTSPTLTTPALGTPTAINLLNGTGLPVAGISGLGTGAATALGVNVGSAGAFVVNGGALGTPSSGTLANTTGLPLSTGISGFGTGVASALGTSTGSPGSLVVNGGALGTPSSGTLTNAIGLPIGGLTGLGTSVGSALGIAVGSAGGIVVNGGVLGTPSSGTLTNATGLPISGIAGLGTGTGTALAVNVGTAGAIVVNGGALGTPSSGTLTNATGLPVAGLSNLGANVGTFLITPSSVNLSTAVTNDVTAGGGFLLFGDFPPYSPASSVRSLAIGTSVMLSASSNAIENVGVGYESLQNCTDCNLFAAVGAYSGQNVTTARSGAYFGWGAGRYNTTGPSNSWFGAFAGEGLVGSAGLTGGSNTGMGEAACIQIAGAAANNTCLGYASGFGLSDGAAYNTLTGINSGGMLFATLGVTANGSNAYFYGNGNGVVAIGYQAGQGTAYNITASGVSNAGQNVITVTSTAGITMGDVIHASIVPSNATVTAIGSGPASITLSVNLFSPTSNGLVFQGIPNQHSGANATFVGYQSCLTVQGGIVPTCIGGGAGISITTAGNFTATGTSSGAATTTQSNVTVNGAFAGQFTQASNLYAFGALALRGSNVTPLTGSNNGAFGPSVFVALAGTSSGNLGLGAGSGVLETSATNETFVGSGQFVNQTSGSSNVGLGQGVGASCITCTAMILIGRGVDALTSSDSGVLNIGNGIYGSAMGSVSGSQKIGINTGALPNYTLEVNGIISGKSTIGTYSAPAISSNILTINLSNGNIFNVASNANVNTLTVSNTQSGKANSFELYATGNGSAQTWTWPASFKWAGGIAPTLTSTNGKVDRFVFETNDGGTTWFGSIVGQNY